MTKALPVQCLVFLWRKFGVNKLSACYFINGLNYSFSKTIFPTGVGHGAKVAYAKFVVDGSSLCSCKLWCTVGAYQAYRKIGVGGKRSHMFGPANFGRVLIRIRGPVRG